jgi:acetyl-CoA acetyltransferase
MERDENRIPVIVGAGEITDRPSDPIMAMEPAALMAEALSRAERDAGAHLLASLDSLDVINEISWPYLDPCGEVAARARLSLRRSVYTPVGGQMPVRAIHDAALRIALGESGIAAICGAEAEWTVRRAGKAGLKLPWNGRNENHVPIRASAFQHPVARALNAATPAHVYPFYENAFQKAQGQTPDEGQNESAEVWAGYSDVAAVRPAAWLTRPYAAHEIRAVSPQNRLIAWPYPKLMTANPIVNQGAAIILTSAGHAKRLGIPPERMIHILGGAAAQEPQDYLARDRYEAIPAMQAVLAMIQRLLPPGRDRYDHYELYSCFPCIPKMARRLLGLESGTPLTVTGGLTFFGAPLNNYMTHAAVAMVGCLRANPGQTGLLYGQGGYATKHHALALRPGEGPRSPLEAGYDVQPQAEALRQPIPRFVPDFEGPATLETFTVLFGREGEPEHGVAIARANPDIRLIARIPAEDTETVAKLMSPIANPIGSAGRTALAPDGFLQWRFA